MNRLVAVAAAVLVLALPASAAGPSPVEDVVTSCPTAAQIADVDAHLKLTFDADPTAGTSVCGTTRMRANVYRALVALQRLQYAKPLPWTSSTPWDWLTHAITGIRFRNDIGASFCCEPANTIDIRTQTVISQPWDDPVVGGDFMLGEDALFVHEARHNEGRSHFCGNVDRTVSEQGAWAAQAEFEVWNALYSGALLDGASKRSVHRSSALRSAFYVFQGEFCNEPQAAISVSVAPSATSVVSGGSFSLAVTVKNGGPGTPTETYLGVDVPDGTTLNGVTASQGTCTSAAVPQQVSCELGAVAGSATVTLDLHVTATSGQVAFDTSAGYPALGALAVSTANDPLFDDNQVLGGWQVAVTAPPPPTTTTTVTQQPKPLPKCKKGQKHRCRRL